MGAMITAGLGVAIFPWKLIESTGGYIFTWLIGYSALLGPIGGILIVDYFLLRGTRLSLNGLYRKDGPYRYVGGFNPIAIVAFVLAVLPNVPGFLQAAGAIEDIPPILATLYTYAWFLGFGIAGLLYFVGMKATGWADRDQEWDDDGAEEDLAEGTGDYGREPRDPPPMATQAAPDTGTTDTEPGVPPEEEDELPVEDTQKATLDDPIDPTHEAIEIYTDDDAIPEVHIQIPETNPLGPTVDVSSVSASLANVHISTDDDDEARARLPPTEPVRIPPPRVEIADPEGDEDPAPAPSADDEE